MFVQITAHDHNDIPYGVTVNSAKIKHIRAVSESHRKVVLSMSRADSPEILHLPVTVAEALQLFPQLAEADEYSPAEARIVGKLLINPAAVTVVRKAPQSAHSVHFDTGGSVTILSVPEALRGRSSEAERPTGGSV